MSNKTQLQNPRPATGDEIPQQSVLNQFQQNNYQEDEVPIKTRLGNSQINNIANNQQQQQNQIEQQVISQPVSIAQNQAIQQRFSNYAQIQNKKQLDQQIDNNIDNLLADDNNEQKQFEKLILLAPSKPYSIEPQFLKCEKCQKVHLTKVESKAGWGSTLCCFLLLFTPAFFLFLIPCCYRVLYRLYKKCKDAHHYCQLCNNKIGTYNIICE